MRRSQPVFRDRCLVMLISLLLQYGYNQGTTSLIVVPEQVTWILGRRHVAGFRIYLQVVK